MAGDNPSTIASGPTVPDTTSKARVEGVLNALRPPVPPELLERILALPETPKPGDEIFSHASYKLVASGTGSLGAAAAIARAEGYQPVALGDGIEGEGGACAQRRPERRRARGRKMRRHHFGRRSGRDFR